MDAKDRKILVELAKNSRVPVQQLARKVGVSREVAAYRIKHLVEEGIIRDFSTVIDASALGYSRYSFLLQLRDISIEEEKKFFSWIVKHPYLTYAGTTVSRWNLALDIFARDHEHLREILQEILSEIKDYLDSYVVVPVHRYESFPVKIVGSSMDIIDGQTSSKAEIDGLDCMLLGLLANHARAEYKELAPSLRLSANAVKYRILRLQKKKIIRGYTVSLDASKMGYEFYNVQIKYLGTQEHTVLKLLRTASPAAYFYQHIGNGNWDFDIGVVVKNSLELRDFLMALRKEIAEGIRIHDVYAIGEMIKTDHIPAGLFITQNINN